MSVRYPGKRAKKKARCSPLEALSTATGVTERAFPKGICVPPIMLFGLLIDRGSSSNEIGLEISNKWNKANG